MHGPIIGLANFYYPVNNFRLLTDDAGKRKTKAKQKT